MIIKSLKAYLLSTLILISTYACAQDFNLPDFGFSGSRGITIQREKMVGEYFMRLARSNLNIAYDPVLNEYLNYVGNRLVMQANNVNFPFEFFIVNNKELNASAFLGGKVQVYTGLFHYSDTEDEFASVLAHEISHVTQRHIARFIEEQIDRQPLTIASMIGAVAMSILNPMIGMAALSTTIGANSQANINFTRDNEYEADRLGIELLYKAGYNPYGMSDLFKKLTAMQGNINPAFSMLIDHPLSEIRTSEAINRARNYPERPNSKNQDFMLAKARVDVRYMNYDLKALQERLNVAPEKINRIYRLYALALISYELSEYPKAAEYLSQLNLPNNIFVVDLKTDIDLKTHNYAQAASRLNAIYKKRPNNEAVVANLANALNESHQASKAIPILTEFLQDNPDNYLINSLLTDAYRLTNQKCQALQSGAKVYGLQANYSRALGMYSEALNVCLGNEREIVRAKMAKLSDQRAFDEQISSQ